MMRYVTVGLSVLAGVALYEVALIPAVAIGGAAILAPTYLRRRRVEPMADGVARSPVEPPAPVPQRQEIQSRLPLLQRLAVGSALAKTITFRVIVTPSIVTHSTQRKVAYTCHFPVAVCRTEKGLIG